MSGCTTCGGYGDRHDPVAHGDPQQEEWEAHAIASLREGCCPNSGRPMFRDGVTRPACSVCDCFDFDEEIR